MVGLELVIHLHQLSKWLRLQGCTTQPSTTFVLDKLRKKKKKTGLKEATPEQREQHVRPCCGHVWLTLGTVGQQHRYRGKKVPEKSRDGGGDNGQGQSKLSLGQR